MKVIFSVLLSVLLFGHIHAQEIKHFEGKIFEKSTSLPISYCSIKLLKAKTVTLSNTEGIFVINLPVDNTDTLLITSIGYREIKMPIGKLSNAGTFYLEERATSLDDVVITPVKITSILNEAIRVSNAAYPKLAVLTGYYKEYVKRDTFLTKYADGIVSYYVEKPSKGLPKVKLSVAESRAKETILPDEDDKFDQLNSVIDVVKIGEYSTPLKIGGLKTGGYDFFNFKMVEEDTDQKQTYIITFEPKSGSKEALYAGKIYIDKETSLITGIDYSVAPISAPYLKSVSILGIKVSTTSRSVSIRYKHTGDDYYLTYVGINYGMNVSSKRYNQNNYFKSEFWLTHIQTKNCEPPAENLYSKKALFKRGNKFSSEFWKNYSFSGNTNDEIKFLKN